MTSLTIEKKTIAPPLPRPVHPRSPAQTQGGAPVPLHGDQSGGQELPPHQRSAVRTVRGGCFERLFF